MKTFASGPVCASLLLLFYLPLFSLHAQPQRGDYDGYYAGLNLMQSRQYFAALKYLDSTAVHPADLADILNCRAVCYEHLGQYEAAIGNYSYILSSNPRHPAASANFANALFRKGDLRGAGQQARLMLAQENMEPYALNVLGSLEYNRKEWRNALTLYLSAAAMDNRLGFPLSNAANAYARLRMPDSAIYYYSQAQIMDPADPENLNGLALALNDAGRPAESIAVSDELINRDSLYYRAYASRAYAMLAQPGYDPANVIRYLRLAIAMEPLKTWYAYFSLGDVYARQGLIGQAIQQYDRAIEMNTNNALSYLGRGNAYRDSAVYGLAIQDYMMAQYLDPSDNTVNLVLGEMMSRMNDAGASEMYFGRYVEQAQNRITAYRQVNTTRAGIDADAGRYDASLRYSEQALQTDPENPEALSVKGEVLAKTGQADSALSYLDRSVSADQSNATAFHNRAYTWLIKGNEEMACADLRRSLELNPNVAVDSLLRVFNATHCRLDLSPARDPELVRMQDVLEQVNKKKETLDEAQKRSIASVNDINPPLLKSVYNTQIDLIERVYPNPATEDFMIYLKGRLGRPVLVSIPSSNGFTGRQYTLGDQRMSVTLSCRDWPEGAYTIILIAGNEEVGKSKIRINH